jgi:SAM-dependent methyltransferase
MDSNRTPEQANSFGRQVEAYDRARPGYPAVAVEWMLGSGVRAVADLGAGTGKFTAALVHRGLEVTAVEPDGVMRAKLSERLPSVTALAGTAEHIPLPDASVDLVTAAQAWHWVDESVALPEAARVLRPGGALALIWNIRDESTAWVKELSGIIQHSEAERALRHGFEIGGTFGQTERFEVGWSRELDADGLVELVASRSYIITAAAEERERIFAAVRRLVATHPQLAGRASFELPYRTYAFRARLAETPIR